MAPLAAPSSLLLLLFVLGLAGLIAFAWMRPRLRRYVAGRRCPSAARVDGKTVVVTGASSGIGKETALELARRGARVIMACRDTRKAEAVASELRAHSGSHEVHVRHLDLASSASIRDFAQKLLQEEPRVDVLINNAGVMMCPYQKTADGFEMQLGVNYLGHFLLTHLLLDALRRAGGRVVCVASLGHIFGRISFSDLMSARWYSPGLAYCQSKLALVMFVRSLASRLQGTGVSAFAVHPGTVHSELPRHSKLMTLAWWLFSPFIRTAEQGAQTSVFCAVAPEISALSGGYFSDCAEAAVAWQARRDPTARRLWAESCRLLGVRWE
ncbi:retinol dehydrogenase 12-like [Lampetra fluviatilis]